MDSGANISSIAKETLENLKIKLDSEGQQNAVQHVNGGSKSLGKTFIEVEIALSKSTSKD